MSHGFRQCGSRLRLTWVRWRQTCLLAFKQQFIGVKMCKICGAACWQVVDAILADSVRTGRRTGIYTMLYAAGILSLAGGQLIAATIFALAGNRRALTAPLNGTLWGCALHTSAQQGRQGFL